MALTMPSASFGSNQVDFGGMMAPASATAMRSAIAVGWSAKATAAASDLTSRSSSLEPPPAADEVDPLVAARIGDAEDRLDHVPGEQRHRQPRHRIAALQDLGQDLGLQPELPPAAAENHADLVRPRRADRTVARLDRVAAADLAENRLGGETVQVAQHAVVVEDGHFLLRQQHGEERAVLDPPRLGDPERRGRAVVAVGDVERRQGVDGAGQRGDGRPSNTGQSSWRTPSSAVTSTAATPAEASASSASIAGVSG